MTKGECLFAVLCFFEYVISSIVVISFSTWQVSEYVASMLALCYLVMLSHDKYQMFYYEIEEPVSEEGSNDAFCPWLTLLNKIDLSYYSSQWVHATVLSYELENYIRFVSIRLNSKFFLNSLFWWSKENTYQIDFLSEKIYKSLFGIFEYHIIHAFFVHTK